MLRKLFALASVAALSGLVAVVGAGGVGCSETESAATLAMTPTDAGLAPDPVPTSDAASDAASYDGRGGEYGPFQCPPFDAGVIPYQPAHTTYGACTVRCV